MPFSEEGEKLFKTKSVICIILSFGLLNVHASCQSVIPSGEAVGVCIQTDGLLVTGITEVIDEFGHSVNAAYKAGLKTGDRIISADGNKIDSIEQFAEYVNTRPQKIAFCIMRNNEPLNAVIKPVKTPSGYKIGVWVRDSTAGIGTMTFYSPKSKAFAALGHGISDIDTGDILTIKKGNILSCSLSNPTKSEKNTPGELNGSFSSNFLGNITSNSSCGIYGVLGKLPSNMPEAMETADISQIKTGDAEILSDVDGSGVKRYSISIVRILNRASNGKNMIIEITDECLLNKTGGIVQGMSGAPIIQSGKLVGAVTHVFVSNPKRGYAIFAENMLNNLS